MLFMNNYVEEIEIDKATEVFVVGDIHGAYSKLISSLNNVGFNFDKDLLIAVGDLVDRGSENEKCVDLLNKKWFKSIRGNHEQFCIDGCLDGGTEFYHKMPNNGGAWFYKYEKDTQKAITDKFVNLPIALEIKYYGKKFGFVHADIPVGDWEFLKELLVNDDSLFGRKVSDHCLWGRNIVYQDNVDIYGVDRVFFGHTVLTEIKNVGNCTFLDTGGVFSGENEDFKFSIVKLKDYL